MTGAATTTATGFGMVTPGDWVVLPLDPRTRDRRIAGLVQQRYGTADGVAHLRRQATVVLRRAAAQAVDRGAFFGALQADQAGDVPLSASALAFIVPAATGADGALLADAGSLARSFEAGAASGEELLACAIVDLTVGRAVRVRKRVRSGMAGSEGREPLSDTVQFFVPLPEAERMLVLTFSTPILPLADAYAPLFDAMAQSARWRAEVESHAAAASD